jgi:hypothetical protein
VHVLVGLAVSNEVEEHACQYAAKEIQQVTFQRCGGVARGGVVSRCVNGAVR